MIEGNKKQNKPSQNQNQISEQESHKLRGKGSSNTWICLIFLFMIFGISIGSMLVPEKVFSENENRFLATKPKFTLKALYTGDYTLEYENYITDQFIFRNQWITLKTLTELAIGKKDINGIYFAEDGYFIQRHEVTDVDPEQSQKNVERLQSFVKKYADQMGAEHVKVMLIPTASEVLTDKLPPFASGYDQNALIDQVKDRLPNETFVDVRDTLLNHKEEYIYYKTDHHWTTLGAYYAYEDWAKSSGFTPYTLDQFEKILGSDAFYGTLYSKVNIPVKPDELYLYQHKEASDYKVVYNMEKETDSLWDTAQLEGKDKYSVYLGGNHALVEINTDANNGRKLIVIKDSFSHCFVPFLAEHFETIYMVDFRYNNMKVSNFIEENEITDILVLYNTMNFVQDVYSYKFLQ